MKQALIGIGSGLGAGLIALGLLFLGPLSPADSTSEELVSSPTATPQATLNPVPETTEPAEIEPQLVQCSVSTLEDVPEILSLQAQVIDASNGAVLFDRASQTPARSASVMKLFTAAAALETLGPDYRITTRIYVDAEDPGKIYFVGAGDVTLSRAGVNQNSVYAKAPKLIDLASQVTRAASELVITEIVLDSSLYGGASGEYQSVWDQRGLTNGYMSPVSALQVDADRMDPGLKESPRSNDPVSRAGLWLKEALGEVALDAEITKGITPATAVQIASVQSRPISEWIDYMLVVSDNSQAEALARLVSLDAGLDGSFDSLTKAFQIALRGTGLDLSDIVVEDGSGLSKYNQISPALVNDLLLLVDQSFGDFKLIRLGMPVSGTPGSLSYRFDDAVGSITAKTGWIRTGYTLAGFIEAPDETKLIFTIYNLGEVSAANREAMDELVMGFYDCGAALVNR